MKRQFILLGHSGQIGGALAELFGHNRDSWSSVSWARLEPSLRASDEALLKTLAVDPSAQVTVICANGVTDPRSPQLHFSNVEVPQRLWSALKDLPNARLMTIGTIHENFPALTQSNPYLSSKAKLGQWVLESNDRRLLHVRLHTIYGRTLKPHMFLSQLAAALKELKIFTMSSGEQLREYHHADDIAQSLRAILIRDWNFGSVVEISSGHELSLAEIAKSIFNEWKRPDLLKIGGLSSAANENMNRQFERSPAWLLPTSRNPLAGLIEFLKEQI